MEGFGDAMVVIWGSAPDELAPGSMAQA